MKQTPTVVETTFRLTSQETRILLQVSNNGKSPVKLSTWGSAAQLVDIGLLRKVKIRPEKQDLESVWSRILRAAKRRNRKALSVALYVLTKDKPRTEIGFLLTVFGKTIADGIKAKISRRYVGVNS